MYKSNLCNKNVLDITCYILSILNLQNNKDIVEAIDVVNWRQLSVGRIHGNVFIEIKSEEYIFL